MSALVASPAEQDKVRELQRTLYRAAKADPKRRFHALYDKIHRRDVLERAWDNVRRNRGAAGIDQMTIAEAWKGRRWVVETDVASCFEAIPQNGLMSAIEERVYDRKILKLLRAMLRAGVMTDGAVCRSDTGAPQGG